MRKMPPAVLSNPVGRPNEHRLAALILIAVLGLVQPQAPASQTVLPGSGGGGCWAGREGGQPGRMLAGSALQRRAAPPEGDRAPRLAPRPGRRCTCCPDKAPAPPPGQPPGPRSRVELCVTCTCLLCKPRQHSWLKQPFYYLPRSVSPGTLVWAGRRGPRAGTGAGRAEGSGALTAASARV